MGDPTDALTTDDDADNALRAAKANIQRKQQTEDIKWLMAHAQGRRFITRVFERTNYRRTPFNSNGSTMSFNAGMQNIGLWLESEVLDASPDAYMKLLKEFARNE